MTGHSRRPVPATPSAAGGPHVTVLPVGDEGLLLEVDDLDAVLALDAVVRVAVEAAAGPAAEAGTSLWRDVTDVVPAARTVLLLTREGTDLAALRHAVAELAMSAAQRANTASADPCAEQDSVRPGHGFAGPQGAESGGTSHEVEIAVRYDGPDLDDVAALTGLTRAEVVAAHTGTPWRVAFGGFAPGFAYLVGGDPRLHVPRRERPRPSVPAGSVGLAGEFSGVYPRSSPGGWQLLGTTDAVLWDTEREPPALLGPGTTVRFVDAAATT